MYINDNVKKVMTEKRITQKELASKIGVSTSTLNNWLKLNRSIPSEFIIPICESLDTDPYFLLTGKENIPPRTYTDDIQELICYYSRLPEKEQQKLIGRAEAIAEIYKEEKIQKKNEYIELKYYNEAASAGIGEYLKNSDYTYISVEKNEVTLKADFILKVSGDSMSPIYNDGDLLLINYQTYVEAGEIGIFIINGAGYVKKFGGDKLISLNKNYDDIRFRECDDILCQGKVLSVLDKKAIKEFN